MKQKLPMAKPEDLEGATLMRMRMENVKCVRLIDLNFDQPLTVIGGDFSQGKSTYLSGYEWCFGGKAVIDLDPIQHGKQSGTILCEVGDGEKVKLRVLCTLLRVGESDWTRTVDIEIPGHLTPSRVQDFLARLAGTMSFDPMSFNDLPAPEQYETLRNLVGNFDFPANEAKSDELFKERTELNRDQKREQAAADAISVNEKAPHDRIDEDALTRELDSAGKRNLERQQRQGRRQAAALEIDGLRRQANSARQRIGVEVEDIRFRAREDIAEIQRQIDALQERLTARSARIGSDVEAKRAEIEAEAQTLEQKASDLQTRLESAEPLPPEIDTSEITARLSAGRQTNRAVADWESLRDRKKQYQAEADRLAGETGSLTTQIDALEAARLKAIQEAKLPVEGIGFGAGFVSLNGVPWKQAGESERVEASTAIGMALNPKLKVILIRNGSGVAKRMRERIRQRAQEKGYRVLMEVVDVPDGTHVVIEDGRVKDVRPPMPNGHDAQQTEGAST